MPIHDLNILWTPTTSLEDLDRILHWAAYLGYDTVALNHIIRKIPDGKISNPLPIITGPLSQSQPQSRPQPPSTAPTPSSRPGVTSITPSSASRAPFPKRILHRATLHITDPYQHHRLPQLAAAYDLLAIRPTTEKAFLAACTSIPDASIISLDLTQRLGYYIKHKNVMTAVKRGVHFEICYSHILYSPTIGQQQQQQETDPTAVSRCFGNWEQLFTATRGRGLIISSEANRKLGIRSPTAIRNLLAIYGLADEKGLQAQANVPGLVVANELLKRNSHCGVVEIVRTAKRPLVDVRNDQDMTEETKEEMAMGKGKRKEIEMTKRKGKGKGDGGKEKGLEREGSSDTGTTKKRKAVESPAQIPTVSKRQAKKVRKAMRDAQEGKQT